MFIALILLLQLPAAVWPVTGVILPCAGATVLAVAFAWRDWSWRVRFFALTGLAIGLTFLPNYKDPLIVYPNQQQAESFGALLDPIQHVGADRLAAMAKILESDNPRFGNEESLALFEGLDLPPYVSLSLLNLNLMPVTWTGNFFSQQYGQLEPGEARFAIRDNRLFFVELVPIPSPRETRGFLMVELLFHSLHFPERKDSWLVHQLPDYQRFRPVIVQQSYSDFMLRFCEYLGIESLPYDLYFMPDTARDPFQDWMSFVWAMWFTAGFFMAGKALAPRWAILCFSLALTLLAVPAPAILDRLSGFASYLFGSTLMGNLLASPFHFFLTVSLAFLLLQTLALHYLRRFYLWPAALFAAALLAAAFFPRFFQACWGASYVHPLDALDSPGALLSFLGFLLIFCSVILLFDTTKPSSARLKFPIILVGLIFLGWFKPEAWLGGASVALIWILKDMASPAALRAALAVLIFYPQLILNEQASERDLVRQELLDEITLLGERNYFRMGRVISKKQDLGEDLELAQHDHLMPIFAKSCGLYDDEIDFALRLIGPRGNVVSEVEQHISLDLVPYYRAPIDRIETYQEGNAGPSWLIYRTYIGTARGAYELVAVLGNDYHNLSLIRRLRQLGDTENALGDELRIPHFAYNLEVYDIEGRQLYSEGTASSPLERESRRRLQEEPYFWFVQGRNTIFLFQDQNYIYRVTHKATPMRMILVRYLALFLSTFFIVALIKQAQRRGRGIWIRWQRSFALKIAAFMFLSSVVPTATLGYLLVSSIQQNQLREEDSLARSQILAAKNQLHDLNRNPQDESWIGGGLESSGSIGTVKPAGSERDQADNLARLPIQKLSRIMGQDLSLFHAGSIVKTNQPEIFRLGLLDRRLPFKLVTDLLLGKKTYTLERKHLANGNSLLVAYCPLALDSDREAIISMTMIPFNQRQLLRWREQLEFSGTILFGLLFLMAGLTRFLAKSFLRPVSAITRGAERMAAGRRDRPITIARQDELQRMVDAFNTMRQKIATSQTRLKQQLGILDETLRSMSTGLLGFDRDGFLILENARAWELLGVDDRPRDLLQFAELRPEFASLTQALDQGGAGEIRLVRQAMGGDREILAKWHQVIAQQVHDISLILALEDITDAVSASRFGAWSEMARRVAHEIKNPLTPIQLEIEHLNKLYADGYDRFGEALGEATREIQSQVSQLRRIATEFGDYARPLEVNPEPVDLVELLGSSLMAYRKTLPKLTVIEDFPPRLDAVLDGRLLRRAVHNLIVNAIQAMSQQGRLTVRLRKDGLSISIWIEDTGPGIAAEDRSRVFEAYFSTKDQGTGLGLVIAKRYITSLGGQLAIDPDYHEGTRFTIDLPIQPDNTGAEVFDGSIGPGG